MPIIGNVGRRSFKVRLLNTVIHLVLVLGAATMVYPFLLMLSGSVKSSIDSRTLSAIPEYFYSEKVLYQKWMEAKYNEDIIGYGVSYRERPGSFAAIELPKNPSRSRYNDWNEFLDEAGEKISPEYYSLGNAYGIGTFPELHRDFLRELKAEPDVKGDLAALNAKYRTAFRTWDQVRCPSVDFLLREQAGSYDRFVERILDFERKQPRTYKYYFTLDSVFVELYLRPTYAQTVARLNEVLGTSFRSWADIRLSRTVPDGPLHDAWIQFVRTRLNLPFIVVAPEARPDFQAFLKEQYKDLETFNSIYETHYASFEEIPLVSQIPKGGVRLADWDQFVTRVVKDEHLSIQSLDYMYRDFLERKYNGDLDALVAAQELGLPDFEALPLTEKLPKENLIHAKDWTDFVRANTDSGWVFPQPGARRDWVRFLTEPYQRGEQVDMAALNAAFGTKHDDPMKMALPMKKPAQANLAARWLEFLKKDCPSELLRVDVKKGSEAWDRFIRGRYNSDITNVNKSYGLTPANFDEVAIATPDADWFTFVENKSHIFWEFVKRNYAVVFQMMMYNGRAMQNTIIYCVLAVLTALLFNPMAAYALSRYKPPSQYKMLLLLMLTMAFPPMVLGIPSFLLMRKMHLLNTFAALILPGIANGYMIFILKGFFDSLPRELYESAQLDGASEWTMFWKITMSTSTPILAVIALGAFTAAYGNFMLAFIVCQDPKMWTMMVHIYQLQMNSSQAVSFASLVVAAIPMLLVFIFCQNIIIRGIVVPTEK